MKIPQINRQRCAALIATALLTFTTGVTANPVGEQVIQGQAGFVRNGNNLIITQGSQRVIINWQDFSNNYGELTKFIQPNSSAAALNRVISGNPSALLGDLEANGHIYLINPNGIVVGAGANINTQSFIASTLDVTDADFMNGGDLNFVGDSQKTIENLGTINGGNGDVFLIAKHVENSGTIKADNHVGLAGGNDVILKASGDDRLSVRVTDKDGSVDQSGLIEATKIELKAANNNPYALAINHEGISRATSAVNKQGRIILSGGDKGEVHVSGTLDASNNNSGQTGGQIKVLGDKVGLFADAKIDVSGDAGGGEVLIGGDYQGKNPDVQNAQHTFVSSDTTILADANNTGDGGKVIVWADESTQFYGNISAQGGNESGNGGFAEVSGKQYLDFQGLADLRAANGEVGQLLLDPTDVIIQDGVGQQNVSGPAGGNIGSNGSSPTIINASTINTQLGLSDLTIQTNGAGSEPGDITVNSAINWSSSNTLNFDAHNSIIINADITANGPTAILNLYDFNGTSRGAGDITTAAGTTLSAFEINITTAGNATFNGALITPLFRINSLGIGGSLTAVNSGNDITNMIMGSPTGISLGEMTLAGISNAATVTAFSGDINVNGMITINGNSSLNLNAGNGGNVNVNQSINIGGDINLNAGDGAAGANGMNSNGTLAAGTGVDGDDGGVVQVNAALTSTSGNINLRGGLGGRGGNGGHGVGVNGLNSLSFATGANGGNSGQGGFVSVDADITAANSVSIVAGSGNTGGAGGFGTTFRITGTGPVDGAANGGNAGAGGSGGTVSINAQIQANDVLIQSGIAGTGGTGGETRRTTGATVGVGGTGGTGGTGGFVFLSTSQLTANTAQISAGSAGGGGNGGQAAVGSGSANGGDGGAGGAAGGISLSQDLILNGGGDFSFNTGVGGNGGFGANGSGTGTNGSNGLTGANGNMQLNNAITTNGNLIFNSGGNITGAGQLSANNIALNANSFNAAIGSLAQVINTNATGIVTASANNGNGGIFLSDLSGNLNLDNADAGTGAMRLTANNINLNNGVVNYGEASTFTGTTNFNGSDVTGTGTTTFNGATNFNAGTIDINDSTVLFNGSTAFNGSTINVDSASDLFIFNNFFNGSITSTGGTLNHSAGQVIFNGGIISSPTSIDISNLSYNGTGSATTSTTNSATLTTGSNTQFNNLTITGGTVTQGGSALNVDGLLSVNGRLDLGGGSATVNSAFVNGTLNAIDTGITVLDGLTVTGFFTVNGQTATIHNRLSLTDNVYQGTNATLRLIDGSGLNTVALRNNDLTSTNLELYNLASGEFTWSGGPSINSLLIDDSNIELAASTTVRDDFTLSQNSTLLLKNNLGFNSNFSVAGNSQVDGVVIAQSSAADYNLNLNGGASFGAGATIGDVFANQADINVNVAGNVDLSQGFTAHAGTANTISLTAVDGSLSNGSGVLNLNGNAVNFATTESASNNTAGDRNIQIGTGGINGAATNLILNSADDVIVDGAINAASVTATTGAGKAGVGTFVEAGSLNNGETGNAGERGGDIIVNQTITSTVGDIRLTAVAGGRGFDGGNSADDGASNPSGTGGNSGGTGGAGGAGGSIMINAALDSAQNIQLTAGAGNFGGFGGDGTGNGGSGSDFSGGFGGNSGGTGGAGGAGGSITINAALDAAQNILLTAGAGNFGGFGGFGTGNGGIGFVGGFGGNSGGTGGAGGAGGSITINAALDAAQNIQLTAGAGGFGGDGGDGNGSGGIGLSANGRSGGTGGTGGLGGSIMLNAALAAAQNIQLTAGVGGLAIGGGGPNGINGIAGAAGEISGNNIDATASNGSITITGAINPDADSSVSLLAGTLAGQLLTLNTPQDFNLTGTGSLSLQGFGFSSANNYSTVDGDISINSGAGDLGLTGTVTATNGDVTLTSGGNLSASQILTGNNINLTATGMDAAIGSTGVGAININASGIITATASNGNGGIFLSNQGDLNLNGATINADTGDVGLTAINGNLVTGTSALNVSGTNLTLTSTEDGSNNTTGDRNIQIGTGGISASNTNLTLTSADDVIIDGAINAASVTATVGDGKHASGTFADASTTTIAETGNAGERGGDVIVNQTITSTTGDINLTGGDGGAGAAGQNGDINNQGGNGGAGGRGGNITIAAALNSAQDVIFTSGEGGVGNDGGDGGAAGAIGGGTGGAGGDAGDITVTSTITAINNINLTTVRGGDSGAGGGALIGASGTSGDTGDGGDIQLTGLINSTSGNVSLAAGFEGRFGGLFGPIGTAGSKGKITGSDIDVRATNGSVSVGGEIAPDLNADVSLLAGTQTGQILTITGNPIPGGGGAAVPTSDINLSGSGNLSLQGFGFTFDKNISTETGNIDINSGDGALSLTSTLSSTNGDVSLTSGDTLTVTGAISASNGDVDLTSVGNLNVSQLITANNINLLASGLNAAIGNSNFIQTNTPNIINATASTGNGGIFLGKQGDFDISNGINLNAGTGDIALTAFDGQLFTDSTTLNVIANNLTLSTTEAGNNNTVGDRNITINSGGINAATTNITFNSADDVVINGAVNAASVTATTGRGNGDSGTFDDPSTTTSAQTGNTGERSGDIVVNQSITTNVGDINFTTERGGGGAAGEDGNLTPGMTTQGGNGGAGARSGKIVIAADINSAQDVILTTGEGGEGNKGGRGEVTGGVGGGNGGNGGKSGDINVTSTITATNNINLTTGRGGSNGEGGIVLTSTTTAGTGGVTGNGGDLQLSGLINSTTGEISLNTGLPGRLSGSIGGSGGGLPGTQGSNGKITGSDINVRADDGDINVNAEVAADTNGDVTLVANTLNFVTLQDINLTGSGNLTLQSNGFNSANNFSTQDGDISINSGTSDITLSGTVNSGNGDLSVTAGGLFNITNTLQGNDISLTHTGNATSSGIQKSGGAAVEVQATGKLNVDTSTGASAKINQTGDLQIGTLTGGNAFGLTGGTSSIELTVQDGDLSMDNTSVIIDFNQITFTAHNGSIDTGTASITVASSETPTGPTTSMVSPGTLIFNTTEDATNNTVGDHNITIGSGGINEGSITLNSADDVVVNGAINTDSFRATAGDGVDAAFVSGQNGSDGERGGNVVINPDIQTNAGTIGLTAGQGGNGSGTDLNGGVAGHGGDGGTITVNGALTGNQDLSQSLLGTVTATAGNGGFAGSVSATNGTAGHGGRGGDININGDVTSNIDISLKSGSGDQGGTGSDHTGFGVGGTGGTGGNIDVQGKLIAQQDITVTSGSGGDGGPGGLGITVTNGTGGVGGNAGNITLRDTLAAQRDVALRTGFGGEGGEGRNIGAGAGPSLGTGGNGGNGGVMDLRAAITAQRDMQLTNNDAGDGGSGNVDGTVGNKGQIIGSEINVTASTGGLSLDGIINANSGVDVQLVAGTDLTLNTGAEINATGAGNIVLAAGNDFHNDTGTNNPLSINTGRFVVYSTRPDNNRDDIGTDTNAITNDFVQYNTTFDSNNPLPASLPAGNGFVYSVQPVLTGVAVTVHPQTINYGDTISSILNTDFTVGGGAGATYEVNSTTLNATQIAQFELADPGTVTINGSDVELNLANTVNISNAGFAAAGSYTDGIEAGVIAGSALASQGIALSGSGDLTVNKINLDVTVAADNKVYDATDVAVLSLGTDNRLAGDVLSIDAGTSTFDDKNVGVGKTVTVTGATLSGVDAGNYNLNITNGGTLSANITQADLIVNGATAQDKVYDALLDATITGANITALLSDTVNLNLDSANFDNKNAGTNKAVTANYSISGTDAANYNLIQPTGLSADVTQRTLNVTFNADDRAYNSFTTATGTTMDDRVAGDILSVDSASIAQFDTKNVGANKLVTLGLILLGTDAANYVLASNSVTDTANITKANLLVGGATAQNKVYDATTTATVTGGSLAFLFGGDDVTLSEANATFSDKNVGTDKAIATNYTISGIDAANYNLLQPASLVGPPSLTANITKADLTVNSAVAQNKVYDTTTDAIITGASVNALASDVVTLGVANANFDNKNVGVAKAVTTNFTLGGTDGGNYNLIQPTTLIADITQADLIVNGATAQNKIYDATTITAVTGASVTALIGDVVTLDAANAQFDTKDAGTGKAVTTNYTLSGTDAANYNVVQPTTLTADITQAALIALANDDSKVFDGLAYSGGNGISYAGFVGGEDASALSGVATFGGTSQGATNPGGYSITPGGLTSTNYDITFVDGGLTINPASSGSGSAGNSDGPNGTFNSFLSIVNEGIANLNSEGNNYVFFNAASLANALFNLRVEIEDDESDIAPLEFLSWAASRGFLN